MGPGRVTTTGEAWMATIESAQRVTQGSCLPVGLGQRHCRHMETSSEGRHLSMRQAKLILLT